MKSIYLHILCGALLFGCTSQLKKETTNLNEHNPVKVTLKKKKGKFKLFVNNEPFYIKGAGLEFGKIAALAKHNANSFRTWRIDNGQRSGKEVLDEAHKNGLLVTMGIEVARERHGFDYNDEKAVQKQFERIKKEVTELKDHSALLIWAIGNELNLRSTNPKVWNAVNDISEMIHEIDPNHLTTTTLAGSSKKEVDLIKERCPDIDLLSFQMYGELSRLPNLIKESEWNGPFMVTEWGATGHWEVPKTDWGSPIEENSTVKAANYLKRYKGGIETDSVQCIGSYVFLWGQKQERTPTWYGLFLEDGKETQTVDVMHEIWNGKKPSNSTPRIKNFTLNSKKAIDNIRLTAGKEYLSVIDVKDPDSDPIKYTWEILYESTDLKDGGDFEERPDNVKIEIVKHEEGVLQFIAPKKGAYRLFVYANDGNNHAATANIPFMVK